MIPLPPPQYEQTMEAIAACGVPSSNIRIAYEDELQSHVVSISDLGGADEAKFRCLRQATYPFYQVEIEDADQREAFRAFTGRLVRHQMRPDAVAWLEARGLMGRVPQYDPATGIEAFARALEAACGFTEGTVLEVYGSSNLTPRREYLDGLLKSGRYRDLACVVRYLDASNADENDIRLMFIGNAASGGRQ